MSRQLTEDQRYVNFVRVALGKRELYLTEAEPPLDYGHGYIKKERWLRMAAPDCKRCGGCGYTINVADNDVPCPCTGIVWNKRGQGQGSRTTEDVLRARGMHA